MAHAGGRPSSMTKATIGKLEQAFAYDATIEEACFYADINPDTYYRYVKRTPKFSERVKALRQRPILDARQKVLMEIKNDVKVAQWYLERKRHTEFGDKLNVTANIETKIALVEFVKPDGRTRKNKNTG